MRCISLAQEWQERGGGSVFVVSSPSGGSINRMRAEKLELIDAGFEPGSAADVSCVLASAREHDCEWIVLDGYHFDFEYQRAIRHDSRKTLLVDDHGRMGSHLADVVLDQNADANETFYGKRLPNTELLLGTSYVLLRREFRQWNERKKITPAKAERILVTMGGSDPDNLTETAIQALAPISRSLSVTVVLGGINVNGQRVRQCALDCLASVDIVNATSEMPRLMAEADLAVIAAGHTLWELLYMGCPVVSFARNGVQHRILSGLHKEGVLHYVEEAATRGAAEVVEEIAALVDSGPRRERMRASGMKRVDGRGAERICGTMCKLN